MWTLVIDIYMIIIINTNTLLQLWLHDTNHTKRHDTCHNLKHLKLAYVSQLNTLT